MTDDQAPFQGWGGPAILLFNDTMCKDVPDEDRQRAIEALARFPDDLARSIGSFRCKDDEERKIIRMLVPVARRLMAAKDGEMAREVHGVALHELRNGTDICWSHREGAEWKINCDRVGNELAIEVVFKRGEECSPKNMVPEDELEPPED